MRNVLLALAGVLIACGASQGPGAQTGSALTREAAAHWKCVQDAPIVETALEAPGPPAMAGQPTDTFATAKRAYDAERYAEAASKFEAVVKGTTGDDEGNRQIAEFRRATSLFHLKDYERASLAFRDISRRPSHLKHAEAALWLTRLARLAPTRMRPGDFAAYAPEQVQRFNNSEQKDLFSEFAFLVGRERVQRGKRAEAHQLLAMVEPNSAYHALAQECMDVIASR